LKKKFNGVNIKKENKKKKKIKKREMNIKNHLYTFLFFINLKS
jgi:hypothetical protein